MNLFKRGLVKAVSKSEVTDIEHLAIVSKVLRKCDKRAMMLVFFPLFF